MLMVTPTAPVAGLRPQGAAFPEGGISQSGEVKLQLSPVRTKEKLQTKPLGGVAFERPRDDLTGYLAFEKPGENIHVKRMRIHILK